MEQTFANWLDPCFSQAWDQLQVLEWVQEERPRQFRDCLLVDDKTSFHLSSDGWVESGGRLNLRWTRIRGAALPGPVLAATVLNERLHAIVFGADETGACLWRLDAPYQEWTKDSLPAGLLSARFPADLLFLFMAGQLHVAHADGVIQVTLDCEQSAFDCCYNFRSRRLLMLTKQGRSTNPVMYKPEFDSNARLSA